MKKIYVVLLGATMMGALQAAQPAKALEEQLVESAKSGNIDTVKALIQQGVNVDTPLTYDNTPLQEAARNGDIAIMKVLVDANADIDKGEWTPLSRAIVRRKSDAVRYLIDAGADVNKAPHQQDTPLLIAISTGQSELVPLLLARGAEISDKALWLAVRFVDVATVKELLRAGVVDLPVKDTSVVPSVTVTALQTAQALRYDMRSSDEDIQKLDEIIELLQAARKDEREKAATRIQAAFRGHQVRKQATQMREQKRISEQRKKIGIYATAGITVAALTAAVTGYITKRLYQNKKKRLVRKYKLGNLTKLQDKIWLATTLASYRVPQYLRRLVRNNPGTLTSFTGKDPRALAELYYGHEPSQNELNAFIARFFAGIQ